MSSQEEQRALREKHRFMSNFRNMNDWINNDVNDDWHCMAANGKMCPELPVKFAVAMVRPINRMRLLAHNIGEPNPSVQFCEYYVDDLLGSPDDCLYLCKGVIMGSLEIDTGDFVRRGHDVDVSAAALFMASEMYRVAGKTLPPWMVENMLCFYDAVKN